MKERFHQSWRSGKTPINGRDESAHEGSIAGRILSTLTLFPIIICLGLWITAFLLFKDRILAGSLYGNILTDLTCAVFFGGMLIAVFAGALAGNLLRRFLWERLIERRK
jgi:hypothetical protein